MNKFSFIPAASSFIRSEDELQKIAGKYFRSLEEIGGIRSNAPLDSLPLIVFVVTGGTELSVLELLNTRNIVLKKDPVILAAHPTHNSLPASLETLARLNQDNINGKIVFIKGPNDKEGLQKISDAVKNIIAFRELYNSRIGLLGKPSDWLVASTPEHEIVKNMWGPEIIEIGTEEISKRFNDISKKEMDEFTDSLISGAEEVIEPERYESEDNVRIYLSLKKIIDQYNLNALTVRCFDLITDVKSTGCFALSQLNDEGYIAGCEGDLVSTVGMLWIYKLLGEIPWMANPAQINEEINTILLAHCTVPRSLVKNYNLRSHFESGIGVGIQGNFEKGPVTVVRIGGKGMEKIWIAEGEIIGSPNSEHLCRTQVEVKLNDASASELLNSPLGNHILMVKGNHSRQLLEFQSTFISNKNG